MLHSADSSFHTVLALGDHDPYIEGCGYCSLTAVKSCFPCVAQKALVESFPEPQCLTSNDPSEGGMWGFCLECASLGVSQLSALACLSCPA